MPDAEDHPGLAPLRREAESLGLAWRGAFHPRPQDAVPLLADGTGIGTLVLLGFVGHAQWAGFAASPEYTDGRADPLDRWSRRLVGTLAAICEGIALYPWEGPPWLPFQRWARRAESVHPSPLGLLIHPEYGLWHAYRGALGLRQRLALPAFVPGPSPCESCTAKPCLAGRPERGFSAAEYERARGACPVGSRFRHTPAQADFHLRALGGDPRRR